MIKRLICLIVILAVCFSFAACTACDSSGPGGPIVDAPSSSEGSSEGDDSAQDSSSSASAAQDDDSASQSEGDDSSNSDSGSDSDNADDNSGTGSDDDSSNSGTGATSAAQTGTGSAQGGFAITAQPVSTSVAVGAPLTLSVSASGSGTLTYQWYTSLTNGYNGIEMIGKTSSTVSLSTSNPFTQYYYCVITQVSTGAALTTNIATASAVGSGTAPTPTPTPTPAPVLPPLTAAVDVWVKGVQITPENYTDVLGSGTHSVYFNGDTNTLTLNGANVEYDGTTDLKSPIHADLINLTINFTGNSTVKSTGGADSSYNGLDAIYSTGAITMEGPGTLTAIGGGGLNNGGSGICADGGLTIFSGTINATGGEGLPATGSGPAGQAATGGVGIYTPTGISVTIWGGTINVTGGNGTSRGGEGINSRGSLYIFGNPTINVKGGNGGGTVGGVGIYTSNDITLGSFSNPFNGSLTVICGEGTFEGYAFAFNKNITFSYFGAGMKYYTRTSSSSKWSTATNLDTNTLPENQENVIGVLFEASS